jgi:3'(2'), 5'-bisphosphate nucleotidase
MALPDTATLLDALIAAALEAGEAILRARAGGLSVERKADASPVTEADRQAEAIIVGHLSNVAPGVPVIGEEGVSDGRIPETGNCFFLVDPLDGTREFVRGGNDFTVNIGLIRDGAPVLGVIYVPALRKLFGGVVGEGAWRTEVDDGVPGERRPMRIRAAPDGPIDVVASRSPRTPETDAYIRKYDVGNLVSRGSSLKFCAVAEGRADLYPRMGTTMQWDTAAGDAILRAAGGKVVTLDGRLLTYGPTGKAGSDTFLSPWFIAAGGVEPKPA